MPANLLSRIPGSASYLETVVGSLKKENLLKTYYRDRHRGYRLGQKAKRRLLADNPERFAFYLTGNAETNLLKCEINRRLRLHRIAEVYLLMQNADVFVFRDEKPAVFSPTAAAVAPLTIPAFYNSREVKELGLETVKIQGSRMAGVLLTPDELFLVYNGGPYLAKWDYRAEQRTQAFLNMVLCRQRLSAQYRSKRIQGILLGDSLETFYQILSGADSAARCFFLLDGNYEHFYYLTNDYYGEVMLKLLCAPDKIRRLNEVLSQDLYDAVKGALMEHDAMDSDGNPVLFGYLPDIPRIHRFYTALQIQDRKGTLICFDFQEPVMRRLFDGWLQLQTISFEKMEGRFFPSAKENY